MKHIDYKLYHQEYKYTLFNSSNNDDYNFYFRYDKQKELKKIIKKFNPYPISLSIIIVSFLISIMFFNFNSQRIDYNNLYSKYYTTVMPDLYRNIKSVYIPFNTTILKNIVENDPNNIMATFYLASSYQSNNYYMRAIKNYEIVINDNDNLFIDEAKWNIALCYLKTQQTHKLKEQLEEISNENNYYSKNAKKILKIINN